MKNPNNLEKFLSLLITSNTSHLIFIDFYDPNSSQINEGYQWRKVIKYEKYLNLTNDAWIQKIQW